MNTTKHGTRALLASAAAGALVLGSAAGVMAKPNTPNGPKPAPQSTVTLQSVSIKGHKTIDLAKVDATSAIKLRAKVLGKKQEGATVAMTLGVYNKRVGGTIIAGSESDPATTLTMRVTKPKRVSFFAGDAVISQVWTAGQIAVLAGAVQANGKAFICIATATPSIEVTKYSMQTKKRLADASPAEGVQLVKRPVRDCVKVINSALPKP